MFFKKLHILAFLISLIAVGNSAFAQVTTNGELTSSVSAIESSENADDDSLQISLLTCSPGHEIHRLYGHSALRIQSPSEDWAVNFGWFSFNTPNFVGKFILGLTDYSMAYQTLPIFILDLQHDDMTVREQVLNLTPEEKKAVSEAMKSVLNKQGFERHDYNFNIPSGGVKTETILGANWTYRYNFLYDNCTTRAVDAIFSALKANGEKIEFPAEYSKGTKTQREMIHEFTKTSPWYEFGQDLLLGPEVDEPIQVQDLAMNWQDWVNDKNAVSGVRIERNFLPTYAEQFFDKMEIVDRDGNRRPLVEKQNSLTPFLIPAEDKPAFPLTPMVIGMIVCGFAVLSLFAVSKAIKKNNEKTLHAWTIWGNAFDFTAWTLQALVGILLIVMVGWSEHPAVGTNWLLLFFNPLYLLCIPARLFSPKWDRTLAVIIIIALTLLIVLRQVQHYPTALIALILASMFRALVPVLKYKKN